MKRPLFFISFLVFALLFSVNLSYGALAGKVTLVEGRVDVLKAGQDVVTPVKLGDPVSVGDIFRAKSNGRAEITFLNGNLLRIAPNTRAEIKEYSSTADKTNNVIKLHRGKVQAISGEEFIKKVAAFAEGNKFEVHTPNAVAGIRGSNMLVSYLRNITATFFLAGRGYKYNPNDPGRRVVDIVAGTISFVTATDAPPTPPRKATEAEQATFVKAVVPVAPKETETKEEAPSTTQQTTTTTTDAGTSTTTTTTEGTTTTTTGTTQETVSDPTIVASTTTPVTTTTTQPATPEPPPPPPPPPPEPPAQQGTNLTGTIEFFGTNGTMTANISEAGIGTITAVGTYQGTAPTNYEGRLYGTSNKDGAFSGPLAGVQGSWLNIFSALYVEGNSLYFLTGEAPGTYDGSTFSMSGSIKKSSSLGTVTLTYYPTKLDALENTIIYIQSPKFFPSPYIISDSNIQITTTYFINKTPSLITDQGKRMSAIGNIYEGSFSQVQTTNLPYLGYVDNLGYGLGPITYSSSSTSTNQRFVIDTTLNAIGYNAFGPYIGTYSMRYLGMYNQAGSFRMAGAGTFVGELPSLFGYWGGSASIYYNNSGVFTFAGVEEGLFGSINPPWNNKASFIAIGEYGPLNPLDKPHYLMNSEIYGYKSQQTTNSIAGSIMGYASAIWKDGSSTNVGSITDGIVRALYVSPHDTSNKVTIGIMKDTFSGSYYPFISGPQMWTVEGNLTPTEIKTGLNNSDITLDSASYSNPAGGLSGSFGGAGNIAGSIYSTQTKYYTINGMSSKFGIFNVEFGANNAPNTYINKPQGNTSWSAKLGGEGRFDTSQEPNAGYFLANATGTWGESGEITGNLTGKVQTRYYLYDLEGKFLGINSTTGGSSGTWIGVALGSYYNATEFSFSGDVSGGLLYYHSGRASLVYANQDTFDKTHNVTGILGGIGNLWSNKSAQVYMMGTYSDLAPSPYQGKPRLAYGSGWYLTYDPTIWTSSSSIGGAFKGYNVGIWDNGAINTEALAIYIDPDKKAGYVNGNLSGSYYIGTNMWELSGTLNTTYIQQTNIAPENLSNSIIQGNFTGHASGKFTPSGGTIPMSYFEGSSIGLTGYNWGIWNLGMGGAYSGNITDKQEFDFGGTYYESTANGTSGFILGHAKTESASSTISGTLYDSKILTTNYFATLTGNIYGTIDTTLTTWQAAGIGKWQSTPLNASLTFSTNTDPYVTLYRPINGVEYEGRYEQYDTSSDHYLQYDFGYIKTSQYGLGSCKGDNTPDKIYLPDRRLIIEGQNGIYYYSQWDIVSLETLKDVPPWMDPNNLNFNVSNYSEFGPIYVLEMRQNDQLEASFGIIGYPWSGAPIPAYIIGQYYADQDDYSTPTIFTTPLFSGKFYTSVQEGTDLGAYALTLGGIITGDDRGVIIGGRGLFIGPNNDNAGVFRPSEPLTGKLYKDINMWNAEGTLTGTVLNNAFSSNQEGVTKDNLSANIMSGVFISSLEGKFTNQGTPVSSTFIGTFEDTGATHFIKGQDWGIFNATIWAGGYGTTSQGLNITDTWIAQAGGIGHFGAFKDITSQWKNDQGMFFMALNGTFADGLVRVPYTGGGKFMTMTKMGTISDVGLIGIYSPQTQVNPNTIYPWQGLMSGVWQSTNNLTFASSFDSSLARYSEIRYGGRSSENYTYYHYSYDTEVGWGNITFYSPDGQRTWSITRKYSKEIGPLNTQGYEEFKYTFATGAFSDYQFSTDYPGSGFTDAFFENLASQKGYLAPNYNGWDKGIHESGNISAIMGGKDSLWSATDTAPIGVYFLGKYDPYNQGLSSAFGSEIISKNVKNNTNTTLDDKGAYAGYIGGGEINGLIGGNIYAIYLEKIVSNSSKAGILKGQFNGIIYSDAEMWYGEGSIYPVHLMDKNIPYANLMGSLYGNGFISSMALAKGFSLNDILFSDENYVFKGTYMALYDNNAGSIGVWQTLIGGNYNGITMNDAWSASLYFEDSTRIINTGASGTKWSDNIINGVAVGYGADINAPTPATWISVGDVAGTFNPSISTFTLGAIGSSIETNTFLILVQTNEGKAQLAKLNYPCVEVGSATLTGQGNNFTSLAMNNVKFFSTAQNNAPVVWATNDVQGTYSAPPAIGTPIGLSGGGLNANFTFKQWNTQGDNAGKWLATVNGGGNLNNMQIQFFGASAGTGATNSSGSIQGTAAGIARQTP